MSRVRVLCVDDERPARAKVARLLAAHEGYELIGEATNGIEALERIEALRPDLVLLDVQMPGLDGFEVLQALGPERDFAVVFSTAYEEHALRAFDAHAVDYLLKPYDEARFAVALTKAARASALRALSEVAVRAGPLRRLVLRTDGGWQSVLEDDVLRISAAGKRAIVVTRAARHAARHSLGALQARLDPSRFVRVHRSEVVQVAAVTKIEPLGHGDALLTLADGSGVVLSRHYRADFLERFGRG